jgi:tRNA (cmo5U34)-methyltransferase
MALFKGLSTVEEIRQRFDADVERFSNLETGQSAAMDAPLALDLVAQAALAVQPRPRRILDLGCGAGNFTLRLLSGCDSVEEVVLVDLSGPMLARAAERIAQVSSARVTTLQTDLREAPLESECFDVILAGAVLHHLRTDNQWRQVFGKIYQATRPGGSFWIFDLITHRHPAIQHLMWRRYGEYLTQLKGEAYREQVFAYATQEDSPRPVAEQLRLLSQAGYESVELLHANTCFAAFGGIREARPEMS